MKDLISTFGCFLTAIAEVWFLEGGLGIRLSTFEFEISLRFPNFLPKIRSLRSFGNSYIMFAIVDNKFCFTCGESDLH